MSKSVTAVGVMILVVPRRGVFMRVLCTALCAVRTILCALALVAATSCAGSHTSPPPVAASPGLSPQIEWLLGPGAPLNAVHLDGSGAGDDALVIGSGNFIFRSAGGSTFEKSKSAGNQPVHDIEFLDPLVGVAVGGAGTIQRTVDGGKTWTPVESGTKRSLSDAAFGDGTHGIAVAGPLPGIVRTEDGGLTWHAQPYEICGNAGLAAAAMLPSQIGMAVGRRGVVIKTIDGGRSWTKLNHGLTWSLLWSVALVDANTAVTVGEQGVILHTLDGGATWARRESGTPLFLRGVAFADASRGLIVGQAGAMLTTNDGGLTWRREQAGTTRDLSGVIFDAPGHAIVIGSDGLVLRYTWATTAEASAANPAGRLP